jgi:hypothetical protein
MTFAILRYENISTIAVSEGGMVLSPQKAERKGFILRFTIDDKAKVCSDLKISSELKTLKIRNLSKWKAVLDSCRKDERTRRSQSIEDFK